MPWPWIRIRSRRQVRSKPPISRPVPRSRRSSMYWMAARALARSRWSGRLDIMPSETGRWASASSTTSRSPPPMLARAASGAWPSWTTTSITATARSGASTAIRRSCSSHRTSIRTIREPVRPARLAWVAGVGFTVNLPLSAGATDADYELAYTKVALPVLAQFRPELILISAGFDAHMNDPLAGMRLTGPVLRTAHGGHRQGRRPVLRRPGRGGDRGRVRSRGAC